MQREQRELSSLLSRIQLGEGQDELARENQDLQEKVARLGEALDCHLYEDQEAIREALGLAKLRSQTEANEQTIRVLSHEIESIRREAEQEAGKIKTVGRLVDQMEQDYQQREDYRINESAS